MQRKLAGPAQFAHLSVATSSALIGVGWEVVVSVAWLALCNGMFGLSLVFVSDLTTDGEDVLGGWPTIMLTGCAISAALEEAGSALLSLGDMIAQRWVWVGGAAVMLRQDEELCDKETKRINDFMHRPATNAAHDDNSNRATHNSLVHFAQTASKRD